MPQPKSEYNFINNLKMIEMITKNDHIIVLNLSSRQQYLSNDMENPPKIASLIIKICLQKKKSP